MTALLVVARPGRKRPFPQMGLYILIYISIVMLHPAGQAHHSCAQTPLAVNIVFHAFFMCFSFVFGPNDAFIDSFMHAVENGPFEMLRMRPTVQALRHQGEVGNADALVRPRDAPTRKTFFRRSSPY